MKPAEVRYYIDQDLLGLGKVLAGLRPDITYPGDPGATIHRRQRPPCPIQPGTLDRDWIPAVAAAGWLIITRDRNIQGHRAEIDAVIEHGARMVAIASDDGATKWGQLGVVMNQWRAIEKLTARPGPFIYTASRTALTAVVAPPA